MPSPSPTTTSAVKLNRRPPLTTLATRLIVTTRSRYALFSGALAPLLRPSPRPRRSPRSPPRSLVPPVREPRCGPGIRSSPSSWCTSELQSGFAGRVSERGDASGVGGAGPVEHDLADARGLRCLGELRAGLLGLRGLVAVAQL